MYDTENAPTVEAPAAEADPTETDPQVAELEAKLAAMQAEKARLEAELRRAKQAPVDSDALAGEMVDRLVRELEALPERVIQLLDEEQEARRARAAKVPAAPASPDAPAADNGGPRHTGHRRGKDETPSQHAARTGLREGSFAHKWFA